MTKHLTPAVRIQKARTALLLDHPFFGSLLFRLAGRASGSIQTMATDGISLFYNPDFVETLNAAELAGVLAHEVMHPALQHHTRRADRDLKRWNMACDYAINPLLLDAGLTLLKDVLIDHRFRDMSAERIYNLIEEQQDQDGSSGMEKMRRRWRKTSRRSAWRLWRISSRAVRLKGGVLRVSIKVTPKSRAAAFPLGMRSGQFPTQCPDRR
jgi:predicted metal-dependent peptidase